MNILHDDISGKNGPNWQKSAQEFLAKISSSYMSFMFIDQYGIPMWKTSNKVVPLGIMYGLQELNITFNEKDARAIRSQQLNAIKNNFDTKFYKEIKGKDVFWVRHHFLNIAKLIDSYISGELYIDQHGIARWSTNNSVIPSDCYESLAYSAIIPRAYFLKNDRVRKEEDRIALEKYREHMKNYIPSAEEMAEMRAAFGPNQKIVDVLSGNTYTT